MVRLHALVFGDGPRTMLAVGGWTGSWEVWEEPVAQLTAAGWRCIAYDHRGAGESPVDPALITVEAMVEDVVGVLDALDTDRCVSPSCFPTPSSSSSTASATCRR